MSVATKPAPVASLSPAPAPTAPAGGMVPAPTLAPWPTPRRLRAALAAVSLAASLLFLAAFFGVRQHAHAVKTVGHDAAPSIIAAERIKAALADMDANVANELIAKPGQDKESTEGYEKRRQELSLGLIAAAENITYGDSERVPIQTINFNLGTYESKVAQARLLHGRGGDSAVLTTYSDASRLMQNTILPAADALEKANNDALEQTYSRQAVLSSATTTLIWVVGLLLLAALVATQVFLSRRTHRVFSLPLLAATALAVLFLLFTTARLGAASRDLKAAKEDAFDSVYALWHARAVAYNANADESRWLIDRAHARDYETDFHQAADKVAALPPGYSYEMTVSECQTGDVKNVPNTFTGFLATELRNITFPGEKDAAVQTLSAWGKYVGIDGQIRALQNGGQHGDAVALCTGGGPDQSNGAYQTFDDALGRTLAINQSEFDKDVIQSAADLALLPVLAPLAMLAVALLAWMGIHARLREYSA